MKMPPIFFFEERKCLRYFLKGKMPPIVFSFVTEHGLQATQVALRVKTRSTLLVFQSLSNIMYSNTHILIISLSSTLVHVFI